MALYCIGDVQGCDEALGRLLDTIGFSPSRDTIYLLGDLVNRGPDSAAVLRRLIGYGDAARCLLGNHDLSLLAVAHGARQPGARDTMDNVFNAPDRAALLEWLRHRPLAMQAQGVLMVHAGVLPEWTPEQSLALASEVQAMLQSPDHPEFLAQMYGNEPSRWRNSLTGIERLRLLVNVFTRLRFLNKNGAIELKSSAAPKAAPKGLTPWFDMPGRKTAGITVAFGHWSQLGLLLRPDILSLDSGCVWGGQLSALRLGVTRGEDELVQVECRAEASVE